MASSGILDQWKDYNQKLTLVPHSLSIQSEVIYLKTHDTLSYTDLN